jgi:nitroimidazol reductase NimA-like FMN-containing flavoprotein (pyridoxamine 5'-phosphate oxidase superfamily)
MPPAYLRTSNSYLDPAKAEDAPMVVYRRANRQYVAMSEHEVWRFLEAQSKVYAGFTMRDGYPHVSPIWFCVADGKIYLRTHEYKMKTKLARRGKVCLVTDDGYLYRELRGVIIWGKSRVITDPKVIGRISDILDRKYERQQWKPSEMPRDWVEERLGEKRAFIEVEPERIDSWDNSKV